MKIMTTLAAIAIIATTAGTTVSASAAPPRETGRPVQCAGLLLPAGRSCERVQAAGVTESVRNCTKPVVLLRPLSLAQLHDITGVSPTRELAIAAVCWHHGAWTPNLYRLLTGKFGARYPYRQAAARYALLVGRNKTPRRPLTLGSRSRPCLPGARVASRLTCVN